ncbi:YigZ family protein [Nocardioides sp. AN3]
MSHYLTIARPGEAEIEVRRSRFLATVRRVGSEVEARAVLERLRREHWDARHHCLALRVGSPPQPLERSNDDGEPAGTAGAPMLEVLRGHAGGAGVSDLVAVVPRWFGGTLLGAGGLVRAYSDAVRAALEEAGTLRRELVRELTLTVSHNAAGRVESSLRSAGVAVLATSYDASAHLTLGAPPDDQPRLAALVAELTAGAGVLEQGQDRWVDRP